MSKLVIASLLIVLAIASANVVPLGCSRPCKQSGAKVLFWGLTPTRMGGQDIVSWLNQNIAAATFDQMDPASNVLTSALLSSYDLIVLSELLRLASAAEATALGNFVNNGGFFFGMSGWDNNPSEVAYTNSYLQFVDGDPSYICVNQGNGCVVSGCTSFYPGSPLLAGIAQCDIDFVGGYASVYPVSFAGQYDYEYMMLNPQGYNLGLSVDLCNANNPTGGRYVLWGDEWISYVPRFNADAGDEQIWFNIINYLGVCVPQAKSQCQTDSDCPASCPAFSCQSGICVQCANNSCKTVSNDCTQTAFTVSAGSSLSLSFSANATGC